MKTSGALVSVVVPAYNADRFLDRTLRSAAAQTYAALEIIIVDDGSTDTTRDIARHAAEADRRVKVISVANGGVARARNIGIENARGDYIAFLDADDLWHPAKIALQVAALEVCDATWAACYTLKRPIGVDDTTWQPGSSRRRSGYILTQHLFGRFVGNGSSLLVRRSAALEVGGFDPSYADAGIGGCEDLDFELKLAARYRIAAVAQFLVGYRFHPGMMSSNCERISRSMLETIRRCLVTNPDLPDSAARYALAAAHNWAGLMLWKEGKIALSLKHRLAVVTHDPLLTAFNVLGWVAAKLRTLKSALVRGAAEPRPFLELSPLDGVVQRPSRYYEIRLRKLAKIDAALEARLFRPREHEAVAGAERIYSSEPSAGGF